MAVATATKSQATKKVSVDLTAVSKPTTHTLKVTEAQLSLIIEALGNEASSWRVLAGETKTDADRKAKLSGGKAKDLLVTKFHPRTGATIRKALKTKEAYETALNVFLGYKTLEQALKSLLTK